MVINDTKVVLVAVALMILVIVVLSLYALFKKYNLIQKIRLPWGIKWDFNAKSTQESKSESRIDGVDFGTKNEFDEIGDVSGGNLNKTAKNHHITSKRRRSSVHFGTDNKFKKKIGDVSGGDTNKTQDD